MVRAALVRAAPLLLSSTLRLAEGHGALLKPLPRNAVDKDLPEFADGKWPSGTDGCNCYSAGHCSAAAARQNANGQACLWFSQGCTIGCASCDGQTQHTFGKSLCNSTMQPTLKDPALRTMNRVAVAGSAEDVYAQHPWRAPGSAPVVDACGIAGGDPKPGGGSAVFHETRYAKQGDLGSQVLQPLDSGTVWAAGAAVEVEWALRYNHGGGYSYRLCPAEAPLTEACFQRLPLNFTGMPSFRWNDGKELFFKPTYVAEGTTPAGSMWAMNPVPRIDDGAKNADLPGTPGCVPGTLGTGQSCERQFDPQCEEESSSPPWQKLEPVARNGDVQGVCSGNWVGGWVVDRVQIPDTLPPGKYVLGWRWDCEETAQVWSSCADVTIVAGEAGGIVV